MFEHVTYPRHASDEYEMDYNSQVAFSLTPEVISAATFGPDTDPEEGFVAPNISEIRTASFAELTAELDELDKASEAGFNRLNELRPYRQYGKPAARQLFTGSVISQQA